MKPLEFNKRKSLHTCAICGKSFESLCNCAKYCSEECRKKQRKENHRKYYATHKEHISQYRKIYRKNGGREYFRRYNEDKRPLHKCEFCGELMKGRYHAHEECLIKHIAGLLRDHITLDDRMRNRLKSIGYGIKDFKEEMGLK